MTRYFRYPIVSLGNRFSVKIALRSARSGIAEHTTLDGDTQYGAIDREASQILGDG
jgi:hypothetical protein